jgi:steroid delta-isomerase-like uncharacterized protein
MSPTTTPRDRTEARRRVVEDHIRFESARDVDSLVGTFGGNPEWHNKPTNDVLHGYDAIRGFYSDLFGGFPDFWLDIHHQRFADEAMVVDGVFGGTHQGPWLGIAPTGKRVAVPFCAVFTFTNDDRLQSEIAYYDRLTLLEQLGVVEQASKLTRTAPDLMAP